MINEVKMEIQIKKEDLYDLFEIPAPKFPKYATQLINLANQNSQGTRPSTVGQLTDLFQEFQKEQEIQEKNYLAWVEWYKNKKPNAIDRAVEKIEKMITELKKAMNSIDRDMIKSWVEDLVFSKTYFGLGIQSIILKLLNKRFFFQYSECYC
ncbi:MAG: MjaI family restriction endonuclease [Promethearchaeota archaeon]